MQFRFHPRQAAHGKCSAHVSHEVMYQRARAIPWLAEGGHDGIEVKCDSTADPCLQSRSTQRKDMMGTVRNFSVHEMGNFRPCIEQALLVSVSLKITSRMHLRDRQSTRGMHVMSSALYGWQEKCQYLQPYLVVKSHTRSLLATLRQALQNLVTPPQLRSTKKKSYSVLQSESWYSRLMQHRRGSFTEFFPVVRVMVSNLTQHRRSAKQHSAPLQGVSAILCCCLSKSSGLTLRLKQNKNISLTHRTLLTNTCFRDCEPNTLPSLTYVVHRTKKKKKKEKQQQGADGNSQQKHAPRRYV